MPDNIGRGSFLAMGGVNFMDVTKKNNVISLNCLLYVEHIQSYLNLFCFYQRKWSHMVHMIISLENTTLQKEER